VDPFELEYLEMSKLDDVDLFLRGPFKIQRINSKK
jgi:hypothetical protein